MVCAAVQCSRSECVEKLSAFQETLERAVQKAASLPIGSPDRDAASKDAASVSLFHWPIAANSCQLQASTRAPEVASLRQYSRSIGSFLAAIGSFWQLLAGWHFTSVAVAFHDTLAPVKSSCLP
jgi:hypothetical protein